MNFHESMIEDKKVVEENIFETLTALQKLVNQ
jgi:hypothetical protein